MFFFLSKTVYFLLMPLGILMILGVLSWKLKKSKAKNAARYLFISLTVIFTNPYLSNYCLWKWEPRPVLIETLPQHDVGIVLTGVAKNRMVPRDRVFFNRGADRVIHTFQLYKNGKINKILIAGGSGMLIQPEYSEARTLKRAFLILGVPDSVIVTEENSRNTRESAVYVKENHADLISGNNILITSAFHMKRASGCFNKVNIPVTEFPVDYYADDPIFTPEVLIPSQHALYNWYRLFREVLGVVAYYVAGYI